MGTLMDHYTKQKAGAGKPVSASKVSAPNKDEESGILSKYLAQTRSGAGSAAPVKTSAPASGTEGVLSRYLAQQGKGRAGGASPTYTRQGTEKAEKSYLDAADEYRTRLAEMQLAAQSGGYVGADLVQRTQKAQTEQARQQQLYGQAAKAYEEQEYARRLAQTKTDTSGLAELLERQRIQQSENQIYGQTGDNAAQRRLALGQRQLSEQIDAYRSALRGEGYTDEEIQSLEGYLTRQRNAEETEKRAEQYRQEAQERGSLGNLGINVGAGLLGGIGYLDLAAQNAFAGEDAITGRRALVDYNSDYQQMYHAGEATMQGEMDKLLEKYGVTDENGNRDLTKEGKIRSGAYQLAVSMGQSAAVAGLTAMGVPGAMLLLSGNAATATAHEYHEKGYSDGTALVMGAISGAAEYVTEKIGMDSLFKTRDLSTTKHLLRGVLKNMGNQALAEGGEEVLSTVINTLADVMVNGDHNALMTRYQELVAIGFTGEQAKEIAAREWLSGLVNDFVMGGLSGMLFGLGGTAFQGARNAVVDTATGRSILSEGQADALRETIDKLDADIREAANVPTLEENASARQTGAAQRGLERAQAMERIRAELAARGEENPSPALLSAVYASTLEQEQRLTREEKQALRGSEAARELIETMKGDQYGQAGEQSGDAAPENGDDRIGAVGEGVQPGEGEGAVPGGEGQVRAGVPEGAGENLRSVTLSELGVTAAAEGATINVQDENSLTGDAAAAAQQVRQLGLEPVAYQGEMVVNGQSVNGYIENGKVFFRTDATYRDGTAISPEAIVRHEAVHEAKNRDPGIIDIGMEIVRESRTQAEMERMMDAYRETYKDLYDFESMSEEEITERLIEEIVADAYAGLNFFRKGGETVDQVRTAIGSQVESQTAGEQKAGRGPPRALLNPNFQNELQNWIDDGKPDQVRLFIGTTSKPLKDIGVDPKKVYWDTSKINKLQQDHPEIDDSVLKQLPDVLERPILIMESITQPNRVIMFGEVYGTNGIPAMVVLELLPTSRKGKELNLIKVANAYTLVSEAEQLVSNASPERTQKKINESTILYIDPDKKRTNQWLFRNRLQLPLGITTYGPIGKITLTHRDVNGNFSAETDKRKKQDWQKALLEAFSDNRTSGSKTSGRGSAEVTSRASVEERKQKQTGRASVEVPGETIQQEYDRLNREFQEEGHDAEYYQSRGRRLNELLAEGMKARTADNAPSKTKIQPDSDIEQVNIADGKAAAQKLLADAQTSEDPESLMSRNAMYRSDIGHIDFRFGTPGKGPKFKGGYGLAHIIAKRNAENGRGLETVDSIIEAIAKAEKADLQYSNNLSGDYHRIRLYYGETTAILSKEPGENHWLLTGWENNETAANAIGEVHDSSDATAVTPTRTRRNGDATVSSNSIHDSSENSNPQNEGRASVEVSGEETGKKYTVREGVEKLFADQINRLTETADRQGIYYDGVQEMLMDALVEARSEEDLDRILAGKDSARFAYSPELTEKLWKLRELIAVKSEQTTGRSENRIGGEEPSHETIQQEYDRLNREFQEEGHDAEYYQSRSRRLNELLAEGADPDGGTESARSENENARSENENAQSESTTDEHPERGPIGKDGLRTVDIEDAVAEMGDIGGCRVKNDAGDFVLTVRRKGDGQYLGRVDRNGKLDIVRSFGTAREAAEFAASYVEGMTRGAEDTELDREKSDYRMPQPMAEQLFDREAYAKEAERQLRNKAAEASTQTLRERIRRANEELKALRRLEKTTGLTEEQKAHKADVQRSLEIANDELESRKRRRKEKKEKKSVTENKPTRSAAEAKNALMELFHTAAGERAETGRAIEQKLSEIFESGKLTEKGRQELFDLLMEKGEVPKHAEETFRLIRDELRGRRIYVSEADRKAYGDNWEDLRRRAWGAGIYLTNDINDKGADVHTQEMAGSWGERLFPTDIAAQDHLENLIELADKGKTTKQSLRDAIAEEANQERVDPEEIFANMWNRMEETLRTYAEKAGLEVDLKNRTAEQLAEEREHWQDRLDKRAQARRESEIRGRLLNGLRRLEKVKNKTAPEVKTAIEEILRDIDTQARQITPAGLEDLMALQRAYEDARKAAGYKDDETMGNWIPNPYVEEKLAALSKKHVNDMSLDEVIELGRTVAGLENTIKNQNRMLGEKWDATIEGEANGVRQEVESARGAKPGFFQKWFAEEHLSPRRFLELLGGWKNGSMQKLARSLEEGQTRMLDFQRRAIQSFDPFLSKKANRKWLETASGKKATWTKYSVVDGMSEDGASYTEIELTPMMKISLYLHSRNMDNLRHIQTGGIVIPNKALYQQGKIAEAYEQGKRVKMAPETVRRIAGELTGTERTFANHMITLFDTISKDAINEVSLQLDGFERAGVANYMPIETARNFLKSDVAGEARAQTVEGIGSIANERIHASNPIMLSDASDVLMRQIDKVSRYYGMAIPIRNFQAVNNYVFHQEGNAFETSVKELIGKKWGSGAEQYITKMLQDLQSSGRRGDMMSRALSRLRGHLAGATLAFNPAVAVSQTASYPGAAQVVGWDGLAAGLVAGKVDTKLIEKYTPLYWYRNQGNSTQELGDYMSEKSLEQKLPWLMNWIQKMDSATIRRLWAAAEYRVAKDNPWLKPGSRAQIDAGTDPYYRKVAEVFNRAVYDTQPNYTNMERAQILRSDSDVTRFLTMYKTVPLQYYGMMVEAAGRLRSAAQGGNKAEIGKARKYAMDTFGGLLVANTVYVAMKAMFKSLRGKDKDYKDEEGNRTFGSYTKQLSRDLLETYAGSIIGGAEAMSVAESLVTGKKFSGPDMSALTYVEDMVNAVSSITGAIGDEDPRKAAGAVKDAAETLAQGFGVPAKNFETYTVGIIGNLWPEFGAVWNNMFGGLAKSDLKSMDEDAVEMAVNLILRNRTGEHMDRAVTDELARLYAAGETVAVPTTIPESFSYNGNTVEIKDRGKYSDVWSGIVGDNLEELLAGEAYHGADDAGKAKMINRLYEYATVQARKGADPDYSAEGNSTYGWTVQAEEAVQAGVSLPVTIGAMIAFSGMTADKDASGNSISGSKKAKVCEYIDGMDLTARQKDVLYLLSGYKENSLPYTPWNGYTEDKTGSGKKSSKSSGKKSGGKSSGKSGSSKSSSVIKLPNGSRKTADGTFVSPTGAYEGFDAAILFGGGKTRSSGTDATENLVDIVDRYYHGNVLEAMMDGWKKSKGQSKVDFKL